jgi:hypothetical protein
MSKRVACGNNRYQPKSSPQYWCTLVDAGSDTAGREHSERAAPWTTGSDSLTRSNRPGRFSGQFYAFQHGAGRPLALRISGQLSLAGGIPDGLQFAGEGTWTSVRLRSSQETRWPGSDISRVASAQVEVAAGRDAGVKSLGPCVHLLCSQSF